MFCPKCGKADQEENTYCRQCGTFLPDFDDVKKNEITPEVHLKANTYISLMTGIVSLSFSIVLFSMFLGREETPKIIYVVAGFLFAMFAWQAQIFWRTWELKKEFNKRKGYQNESSPNKDKSVFNKTNETNELLPEADLSNIVPASVTENTTTKLKEKINRST